MSSEIGNMLHLSVFGESHGRGVGAVIDGLPAGEPIDLDELQRFCDRRRPGSSHLATARCETDVPEFVSGLHAGATTGFPLCFLIRNADVRSGDYAGFTDTPRPSHADFTAAVRYGGHADMRGSGHFSGRLTAPLCVAGGIARQLLARRGVLVGAHLRAVGDVEDKPFDSRHLDGRELTAPGERSFPVISEEAGRRMQELIERVRAEGDSVGARVECAVTGLPTGLGSPMFDGVENRLAAALFRLAAHLLRRHLLVHQGAPQRVEEGLVQHRRQLLLGAEKIDLLAAQLGDAQLVGLVAKPDLRQKEGGLHPGNHLAEELRGAPAHAGRPQGALRVGIGKNHPPPLHEDGALSGHLEYLQCRFKHVSPPS